MPEEATTMTPVYRPLSISRDEEAPLRDEAARQGVQVLDSGTAGTEPDAAIHLTLIGDEPSVRAVNQFVKLRRGG